jgi:pyruvate carboxylase
MDGVTCHPGAQNSPHYDSLLSKLTCRGRDYASAVTRSKRALAEFRIRGVSTNIPFLQAVLDDPDFAAGDLSTSFIDEARNLLRDARRDRHEDHQLARDVTVNQPRHPTTAVRPVEKLPPLDLTLPAPAGSRQPAGAGPGPHRPARADRPRRDRHDLP